MVGLVVGLVTGFVAGWWVSARKLDTRIDLACESAYNHGVRVGKADPK